jgi:hypothetical protein
VPQTLLRQVLKWSDYLEALTANKVVSLRAA